MDNGIQASFELFIKSTKILKGDGGDSVHVVFNNGKIISFEDIWLKDNCRCQKCYNSFTKQRSCHLLDLSDSRILTIQPGTSLYVSWDDGHESEFKADFLAQHDWIEWAKNRKSEPKEWKGRLIEESVTRIDVKLFLNTQAGAKKVFKSLIDYGVAFITGLEPSEAATETVVNALGGVQRTLFGDMWTFTTLFDHADTAYTNIPLANHNDNTYFEDAAGLQILHCLEHSGGLGGKTTLADGLYAAKLLKTQSPALFEALCQMDFESEYCENGNHMRYRGPVFVTDKLTGEIKQVRFNAYDRTPAAFRSAGECRTYYKALIELSKIIEDPTVFWQFKLLPGTALVMNNRRVMHGRTAFTGKRVMTGAYVTASDWQSKARVLGLLY